MSSTAYSIIPYDVTHITSTGTPGPWRRQLPAYSPLTASAVLAASAAVLGGPRRALDEAAITLKTVFGSKDVVLTDSATGALSLAMRGSAQVALPAYGCYDLATAALGAGARVVLYDVIPETLAPEPASFERAARQANAVVVAPLFGIPFDPPPMNKALIIEDAAQGWGASYQGRPLGSFGDVSVLSFGRAKGVTAGHGGALFAGNERGGAVVRTAHAHLGPAEGGAADLVRLAAQWLLGRPSLYRIPASLPFLRLGETVFRRPSPVRSMSGVAAGALAVTLQLREREAAERQARATRLLGSVRPGLTPIRVHPDARPGYLRLPFLASAAAHAAAAEPASRALGIMHGYPLALCDLPGFGETIVNRSETFPGARMLASRLITLPVHSRVSPGDERRISNWMASCTN